ncbi:unnamed protein product, partial [Symbiodinium sp. CCMP2456]
LNRATYPLLAAAMPKRRFQAHEVALQEPIAKRNNNNADPTAGRYLIATVTYWGSAAYYFNDTPTTTKLWQVQVDHAGYNNFSYKILGTVNDTLRNYPDSNVTDLKSMEQHLKIRILNGAPSQQGEDNDPDGMQFTPWRAVLYLGNDDLNPILDLIHRILKHKMDQAQILDIPVLQVQSNCVQWNPAQEDLPQPWQLLRTEPEWMPNIFKVLPPRGRRHIVCQLETAEDDHYNLMFLGGLYVFREQFDAQQIPYGYHKTVDPTEKRIYVRLLKVQDSEDGKNKVLRVVNNVLHHMPVYFYHYIEDKQDPMLTWADTWFLHSDQHETLWQVHLQHTQPSYTHISILSGIRKFLASGQHGMQGVRDFQSLEEHAKITVLNHALGANSAEHTHASENIPTKPVFYVHQKSLNQFFRFLRDMLEYEHQRKQIKQELPHMLLHCNSPNSYAKLSAPPAPWTVLPYNTPNTRVEEIFKLPPPRGTRHTKCNVTKSNGKYMLTFRGGLFDQPQMFERHNTEKRQYEAGLLLCVKNDQKGRGAVIKTLATILQHAPICLQHRLKNHRDDFLSWRRFTETYKSQTMYAKTPASAALAAEKRGVAVVRLNLIVQRVISHLSMPVRPSSICDQIINDTFDFSEESASTTSGTFSCQQLSHAEKSEEEDGADTRSSAPSNHDAEPDLPVADNKGHPDIGDSILTLYPQALQNILAQVQDTVVVGTKVKRKCTWLASQGCIKARALIEQVRRIDLKEFHELYQHHHQLDPPDSKNFYALTITNVRQTNVDFNYYQLTAPSLFTRYRTAPSDLCPISSAIGWVRLLPTVLPIALATLLEHLDAWALQNLLQTSKCGHGSPQHQSLRRDARDLRQTLTILTHNIRLPGLPLAYDVTITPQHLLDQQSRHHSLHASITKAETSATTKPTNHGRHMQDLLRQGKASTFTELVKNMNPSWQQNKRFQAFLHFLNDSHTTISYTPQFSQSEYHFRDIISPARLQVVFRYRNHSGFLHAE